MKTLNIKKILSTLMLLVMLVVPILSLSACKNGNYPPAEEEIEMGNGVNVVIDMAEFDSLLSQAKLSQTKKIYKLVDAEQYSKADLLMVINQIKENIEGSTAIGVNSSYTYDGYLCEEIAVATIEEKYSYSKQLNQEGNQIVAEYHSWTKKEGNDLYYYEKAYEAGETRKTRQKKEEPYLNNNAVYDFCQGIFTFTSKTLTEEDIESFKINKNKVYIKIKTTIFHDVEDELEVKKFSK